MQGKIFGVSAKLSRLPLMQRNMIKHLITAKKDFSFDPSSNTSKVDEDAFEAKNRQKVKLFYLSSLIRENGPKFELLWLF